MTLRLKLAAHADPAEVRKDRRRAGALYIRHPRTSRPVYLAAEVASTYGAEWTGPAAPEGWDDLPALRLED